MANVRPGMDVIVIGDDNQVRKGNVLETYDFANIAIVQFGDSLEKVPFDKIGIDPFPINEEKPVEEPTEQDESKFIEKKEVTLTRQEFFKIGSEAIVELGLVNSPVICSIVEYLIAHLGVKLFTNTLELKENE